jgi:hypothetical protein
LLCFTLDLVYVPRSFMHKVISPTILIIMSYGFTECTVYICRCLDILLHVILLTSTMFVFAYLALR